MLTPLTEVHRQMEEQIGRTWYHWRIYANGFQYLSISFNLHLGCLKKHLSTSFNIQIVFTECWDFENRRILTHSRPSILLLLALERVFCHKHSLSVAKFPSWSRIAAAAAGRSTSDLVCSAHVTCFIRHLRSRGTGVNSSVNSRYQGRGNHRKEWNRIHETNRMIPSCTFPVIRWLIDDRNTFKEGLHSETNKCGCFCKSCVVVDIEGVRGIQVDGDWAAGMVILGAWTATQSTRSCMW